MCGIFGLTNFKFKEIEKSRNALNTLIHRGPDQWGEWYDNNIYIGHRRLSILDLSDHGKQPMFDPDQEVIIAANGEIYNFNELKKKLILKYNFGSNSDSEVILHGYKEWGIEGLLQQIEGMFAFSIYDKRQNLLFLVRDRVGIKPLYYTIYKNRIIWASELKAIKKFFNDGILNIDKTAIYDYFTYKYIPTPKTMYKNVHKLEPAHYLKITITNNKIEKLKYWELPSIIRERSLIDAAEGIKYFLSKSIKEQMISDVPLGFFLSGGIDSSISVAIASQLSDSLKTYTIGFQGKKYDERTYARIIADKFITNHKEKTLKEELLNRLFSKFEIWFDEPFGDTSAFPTYLVSEFARKDLTVVLTGDGGDEILGGYTRYNRFPKIMKHHFKFFESLNPSFQWIQENTDIKFLKKIMRKVQINFLLNEFELTTNMINGLMQFEKKKYKKLFGICDDYDDYWYFRKYYRQDLPFRTRFQYLDFHTYLPDEMLTKVDRASMAVSLEARVPFLNRELIEFCFSIDERLRYWSNQLKGLAKYAFKDDLPSDILYRNKKGFSIPIKDWKTNLFNSQDHLLEGILTNLFKYNLNDI